MQLAPPEQHCPRAIPPDWGAGVAPLMTTSPRSPPSVSSGGRSRWCLCSKKLGAAPPAGLAGTRTATDLIARTKAAASYWQRQGWLAADFTRILARRKASGSGMIMMVIVPPAAGKPRRGGLRAGVAFGGVEQGDGLVPGQACGRRVAEHWRDGPTSQFGAGRSPGCPGGMSAELI